MFKKGDITSISKSNDIRYVAPLSYRHLRIFGWLMMLLMQISIVLALFSSINAKSEATIEFSQSLLTASDITGYIGQLAVPFFLLANFALIISSQENIKKLVIFHASMAVLIYVCFILLYDRYFMALATKLLSPLFGIEGVKIFMDVFIRIYFTRYLTLNVFVDLLMCSLLYFFLIYKPKKIKKNKLIFFRLLVIFPILFEAGSAVIKGLSLGANLFLLPIELIPLLTNKPIVTFLAFLAIVIYLKYQEKIYRKLGGQYEEYQEFLTTNAHNLQFDIVLGIIFAVAGILDLIVTIILLFTFSEVNDIDITNLHTFKQVLNFVQPWGFGKGISLLFFSPITLLLNYRKKYSNKTRNIDMLIPLIGMALFVLVFLEGFYQLMNI